MNFLIVRLGALGDIVHTVPAAAALRAGPSRRAHRLARRRAAMRAFVELVLPVDRIIRLEKATVTAWVDVVRRLRPDRYDVALDFQGLMKSAVLARASGAARVVGFSIWHLREKGARPFYSEVDDGEFTPHVIGKNLRLLSTRRHRRRPRSSFRSPRRRHAALRCRAARRRRRAVRADQSRRGVAEQALAAGALRRGRLVPARCSRAAAVRAVGAGEESAGARRRRGLGRRRADGAADDDGGSAGAVARARR